MTSDGTGAAPQPGPPIGTAILLVLAVVLYAGMMGSLSDAPNSDAMGRGMALAGLIIGYASIFIWIAYVIFFGGITAIQQILNSMNH